MNGRICFKVMKGENPQPRLLYPATISFRFEGKSKASQTRKSEENSAPPNQLFNRC